MKSSGGTPTSYPMKGAFKGGGPGGGEDGERVFLGGEGLDPEVLGVVWDDGVDEVVVSGGGGELVDEVAEVVEPGGVEAGEVEPAAHLGSGARLREKQRSEEGRNWNCGLLAFVSSSFCLQPERWVG